MPYLASISDLLLQDCVFYGLTSMFWNYLILSENVL
jgi:hypothetical protein